MRTEGELSGNISLVCLCADGVVYQVTCIAIYGKNTWQICLSELCELEKIIKNSKDEYYVWVVQNNMENRLLPRSLK